MLTDADKRALSESWKLVRPISETVGDLFYRRLFELRPDYRSLFPEDMQPQKKKLVAMLAFIVRASDWSTDQWQEEVASDDDLFLVVLALGRRHSKLYNVPDESYPVVGEALMWTLDYGLGDALTPEVKTAWEKVYGLVSAIMIMGANNATKPQQA